MVGPGRVTGSVVGRHIRGLSRFSVVASSQRRFARSSEAAEGGGAVTFTPDEVARFAVERLNTDRGA